MNSYSHTVSNSPNLKQNLHYMGNATEVKLPKLLGRNSQELFPLRGSFATVSISQESKQKWKLPPLSRSLLVHRALCYQGGNQKELMNSGLGLCSLSLVMIPHHTIEMFHIKVYHEKKTKKNPANPTPILLKTNTGSAKFFY